MYVYIYIYMCVCVCVCTVPRCIHLFIHKKVFSLKKIAALIQDSLHFDKLVAFFFKEISEMATLILFFFHLPGE